MTLSWWSPTLEYGWNQTHPIKDNEKGDSRACRPFCVGLACPMRLTRTSVHEWYNSDTFYWAFKQKAKYLKTYILKINLILNQIKNCNKWFQHDRNEMMETNKQNPFIMFLILLYYTTHTLWLCPNYEHAFLIFLHPMPHMFNQNDKILFIYKYYVL